MAYVDGNALELTLKEFELLSYLFENPAECDARPAFERDMGYDCWGRFPHGGFAYCKTAHKARGLRRGAPLKPFTEWGISLKLKEN